MRRRKGEMNKKTKQVLHYLKLLYNEKYRKQIEDKIKQEKRKL